MIVNIDIWKAIGLVLSLVGAFWALVVVIVRQFNASLAVRFETLEKSRTESDNRNSERFQVIEQQQKAQERELLTLKAELPDKYVKREDAIRSEMTLHAKFDGLANTIYQFLRTKEQ